MKNNEQTTRWKGQRRELSPPQPSSPPQSTGPNSTDRRSSCSVHLSVTSTNRTWKKQHGTCGQQTQNTTTPTSLRFLRFLLILNTFIPKRQKNNISQHLFSHWLCLISILLNIQSNFKYSLRTSNFSPYKKKCKGEPGRGGMYIFHNLYSSGMELFDHLRHNTAADHLPKKGVGEENYK